MKNVEPKNRPDRRVPAACLLIACAVWGVFGQTLRYEFVNYDDGRYVCKNPVISKGITAEGVRRVFTQQHGVNWHPLTSLSHMLDAQIFGLNPGGHHAVNVLLHMATAILLFLILRQMTGSLPRSAAVALLFAVHPLRAESVAWVSERKDVLSGLFFMLTLGAWLRYARRPFSIGRYAPVVLLFTAGLMAKPMLVTLPLVLLLLDFWPLKRFQTLETGKAITRLLLEKIPLLLLSALFCFITVRVQESALSTADPLALPWRIGNAVHSYAVYLRQMIFPSGLALLYPHPGTGLPLWQVGASALLLTVISLCVWAGRKKYPYLITGWCWYLIMLAPVIGILQVGPQAHADRYTYLPQIGPAVMVVWLIADRCAAARCRPAILSTAAAVVLILLAVTAHRQARCWRNSIALWTNTVEQTGNNCQAHNNLGGLLARKGEFGEAVRHLQKAVEINPAFADPSYNLGVIFASAGQFDRALPCLEKALALNPGNAEWRCTLGYVFARQGDFDAAAEQYRRALAIDPNCVKAKTGLETLAEQSATPEDPAPAQQSGDG